VKHLSILGRVDLLACEHRIAPCRHARAASEVMQFVENLAVKALTGEIKVATGEVET
jgi:hypothetical protein